jgi:60 kDa SS-A/Ro ribonucleoprotein
MAKFNTNTRTRKVSTGDTVNLAGGEAYTISDKEELVSILLTSFVADQFYRDSGDTLARVIKLIEQGDKQFAAKAAIFARDRFGMRSISHVVAGEIARLVKGEQWTSRFFDNIVVRPDDMLEIFSYVSKYCKKKVVKHPRTGVEREVFRAIPNAMKRGFREAIGRFDAYQLAKYRGEGKDFSLVDVVNLVNPKATQRNAEALALLVKGGLKSTATWESMLTRAGQVAEDEVQLDKMKADAWKELITSKKIGYMALLRNLRNIIDQAPSVLDKTLELLVDEKLIKKSRVLPFRYFSAYREVAGKSTTVGKAIGKAATIACDNAPAFEGKTLICLDDSGSMVGNRVGGKRSTMDAATIGAMLATVMKVKNPSADFIMFNTRARYVKLNLDVDVLKTTDNIVSHFESAGTDFKCIFKTINTKYDRIVIFSDMQGWVDYHSPTKDFRAYCEKFKTDPFVYSVDLTGYGSMQFDPKRPKVFMLAGFSEKMFDIMKLLEADKNALVNEIDKIEI